MFLPANPKKEAAQRHPCYVVRLEISFMNLAAIGVVFQVARCPDEGMVRMLRGKESIVAWLDNFRQDQADPSTTHMNHT